MAYVFNFTPSSDINEACLPVVQTINRVASNLEKSGKLEKKIKVSEKSEFCKLVREILNTPADTKAYKL